MTKSSKVYRIENALGEYLGTFRGRSPREAIDNFVRCQLVTTAQFRRTTIIPASDVLAVEIFD